MAEGGVPDLETQKKDIANLIKSPLKKGDTWYLLDVKWLKQWKKYVGYDSWDSYTAGEESANPGPIDNAPLFKDGAPNQLKEHLIDELDYMLIPTEGWNKLVAWYGLTEGQDSIGRKVIEEGIYSKSLKVEVHPWHLKLCENSNLQKQITKEFSRSDTIEELEKAMRKEFSISEDKEVRLWNRYMSNTYEQLNKPENTLQDAGLYQGQVIVIEQKNEDGTWPRQAKNTSSYSSSSASGSSFSTRSGNTYGNSSSYENNYYNNYEPGRGISSPGLCGLSNLGNTCFMNSAIQCMSNVPELSEYFLLNDQWVKEINEDNPLGMHGEIARSYAELIQTMWSGKYSYTVPRNFKWSVGRFAPQFSGYQQQDSQELMAFLLDGLHEDLNRIRKKPYVELKDADGRSDAVVAKEAWDNYKKRNDSVIVDIFHGLLKSTVHCPECAKISVTFDPFCYLSLPLPVKKERQLEVFWVPMDPLKKPKQFKLTVPKMGCVADMCKSLSTLVDVSPEFMVVTDVYNHRFHKVFSPDDGLSHIMDRDDIFIYQCPVSSANDPDQLILPVYLRERRSKVMYSNDRYVAYQLFGQPLLLPVPRKGCTYDMLYNLVLQRLSRFVKVPANSDRWWVEESADTQKCENDDTENANGSDCADSNQEESPAEADGDSSTAVNNSATVKQEPDSDATSCNGEVQNMDVSNGEDSTSCSDTTQEEDKSSEIPNGHNSDDSEADKVKAPRLFKFTLVNSYGSAELDHKLLDDGQPLKLNGRSYIAVDWHDMAREKFYCDNAAEEFEQDDSMKYKAQKKQVIQLNDCLELFTTTERLGENDPWYCPQCKKHQQATKKFDLWSLPDILIIHLKRFSYNRYWRDKIDTLVEFPTRGLDMKSYVISEEAGPVTYDLIGVSNHYGGLGGGHYTAYCKNHKRNQWYYFDDSSVSESSEESSVTKAAYVLVYERQGLPKTPRPVQNAAPATATSVDIDSNVIEENGLSPSKNEEEMETN